MQAPKEGVPHEGCGHFIWYDGEMDSRAKEVINGLKMENKRLKYENTKLKKVADWIASGLSPHVSIEKIKEDVRLLKEEKVSKMEKMRKQFKRAVVAIILSWSMFVFFILFIY